MDEIVDYFLFVIDNLVYSLVVFSAQRKLFNGVIKFAITTFINYASSSSQQNADCFKTKRLN
jgi:hypothetical protein